MWGQVSGSFRVNAKYTWEIPLIQWDGLKVWAVSREDMRFAARKNIGWRRESRGGSVHLLLYAASVKTDSSKICTSSRGTCPFSAFSQHGWSGVEGRCVSTFRKVYRGSNCQTESLTSLWPYSITKSAFFRQLPSERFDAASASFDSTWEFRA